MVAIIQEKQCDCTSYKVNFKFRCLLRSTKSEHPREKSDACVFLITSISNPHSMLDVAKYSALVYYKSFIMLINAYVCSVVDDLFVECQYSWSRNPYWSAPFGYKMYCFWVKRVSMVCQSCGSVDWSLPTYRPLVNVKEPVRAFFQFRALLGSSTLARSFVYWHECSGRLWSYIVWLSNSLLSSHTDIQAVLGFLWKFHRVFLFFIECPFLSQ